MKHGKRLTTWFCMAVLALGGLWFMANRRHDISDSKPPRQEGVNSAISAPPDRSVQVPPKL